MMIIYKLLVSCFEMVSIVTIARQHLYYTVKMVSMMIALQPTLQRVAFKQFP